MISPQRRREVIDALRRGTVPQQGLDALALGNAADAMVAGDVLPGTAEVLVALNGVEAPAMMSPQGEARTIRLAASCSAHAATSSRLDLYPQRMPAERAVSLARSVLVTSGALSVEAVQSRVRARFPDAQPVPDRPLLDHLVAAVGLEWNPEARAYHFIGKDNIPFHAIIWPAELMAYDPELVLPYDVPANEFLNLEGRQFSTSRNWAVWLPDYLSRYAPDPLRYELYFERFMDPDRDEMPDIDMDMCQNGRERVIEYVREKYGHVAQIVTFGTLKAKAAIKDVGRVLGMGYNYVDSIAKLIPNQLGITLKDAIEHRLSVIGVQIRAYENQYGMNFEQFQSSGRSGELQAPTSYRIECDYFEWDSLITRRKKLNDILQWLA